MAEEAAAGSLLLVSATPTAGDAVAESAALAVAAALGSRHGEGLLIDLSGQRRWRPTLLAAAGARSLATAIGAAGSGPAVARGHICVLAAPVHGGPGAVRAVTSGFAGLAVVHALPSGFRELLEGTEPGAVLIRTGGRSDSALAGAVAIELRQRRLPVKVWARRPGLIQVRRALAGLDPGGETARRARRVVELCARRRDRGGVGVARRPAGSGLESGQALPAAAGLIVAIVALALALAAIGGGATAKGRAQRAVDLAALSAGRSMRDDLPRLFEPALLGGRENPRHLSRSAYLRRAGAAAREAADRNGLPRATVAVSFADRDSLAPLSVRVVARPTVELAGVATGARTRVAARAVAEPAAGAIDAPPAAGSGGGYSGPLAYRQGRPIRPDVAAAFDRMERAASTAGLALTINSGFRSDAEQASLFAANPDPRWVAPPGRSLHRCGTELDLGPPSSHGWLAANAGRFGFEQRYSWEPWHFGYVRGPEPCSAVSQSVGRSPGDGRGSAAGGLPDYVPGFIRAPLLSAASRHGVSAALLAAQLLAESNFNPAAVSSAGARGIAQFMPATAAAYGLDDPLDPVASIDAQARLMADLLAQFGSTALALAAYNAGPGAVSECGCAAPFAETGAYVARILALIDGAVAGGTGATPPLEVRLVH